MVELTLDQYLMGREKESPITNGMREDAIELLKRVNALLAEFYKQVPKAKKRIITSGYRTAKVNAQVGGAKKSNHMLCRAVDLSDPDQVLDNWLTDEILEKFDLYREDPSATKTWVHLQSCPPKSKKRTFLP